MSLVFAQQRLTTIAVLAAAMGWGLLAVRSAESAPGASETPTSLSDVLRVPTVRVTELRNLALSRALERQTLRDVMNGPGPSPEESAAYVNKFRDRFVSPEAIDVWRILVGTEERAKQLIEQLQKSDAPQKTWSHLAREYSLDKATHFRRGHLGFVREDGSTDVPQVRVSRAIFASAKQLADGAYTGTPVAEGENWAIIWRRGHRAEQRLSEEETRRQVQQQLGVSKARIATREWLQSQRAARLQDYHPELLEALPTLTDRGVAVAKPPHAQVAAEGDPRPKKTDWGER